MLVTVLVALALTVVGCSNKQTTEAADAAATIAEQSNGAAVIFDGLAAKGGDAAAALNSPLVQAVMEWLPPNLRERIDRAVTLGLDLPPVLSSVATELRTIGEASREQETRLRDQAAREASRFDNFMVILAAALTGGGVLGGAAGRLTGVLTGMRRGAAQVVGVINEGRTTDPAFDAMFQGEAGKAMRAALVMQASPVVAQVVRENKV
jgi:hypothetical protein